MHSRSLGEARWASNNPLQPTAEGGGGRESVVYMVEPCLMPAAAERGRSAKESDMMKRAILILVTIVAVGIPVLQAESPSVESIIKTRPLKGLESIAVLVEGFRPEGAKAGVSEEELKAFVELKLRQSGVVVRDINKHTLESPYLYINVNLMYLEEIDHFTYSASVSLNQTVRLLRNETTLTAATWNKGTVAIIRKNKAREDVKNSVDSLLTFFLNDYLSANPQAGK